MNANPQHGPKPMRWLAAALRTLSAALVAVLLGLIVVQVAARYVFGAPIAWSEEVARFVFIWLAFLAGAFVMAEGRHIAVDVIGRAVGRDGRVAIECFAATIAALIAVIVLIAAVPYIWQTMGITSPSAGIPMGLWRTAVAIGLALMGLHAVVNAALAIRHGEPIWARSIGAEAELGPDDPKPSPLDPDPERRP